MAQGFVHAVLPSLVWFFTLLLCSGGSRVHMLCPGVMFSQFLLLVFMLSARGLISNSALFFVSMLRKVLGLLMRLT